jgi:hypothetical protein
MTMTLELIHKESSTDSFYYLLTKKVVCFKKIEENHMIDGGYFIKFYVRTSKKNKIESEKMEFLCNKTIKKDFNSPKISKLNEKIFP